MKKSLQISATIDQQGFLNEMIERLAYKRTDLGYRKQLVPDDREALDISSTEAYVSGVMAIEEDNEIINMPFITSFLFTCTKGKSDIYKLEWVSSLS